MGYKHKLLKYLSFFYKARYMPKRIDNDIIIFLLINLKVTSDN